MHNNPAFEPDEIKIERSNKVHPVEVPRTKSEYQLKKLIEEHKKEKWYLTLFQIVIPFILAGLGMVAAGVLLDYVQDSDLFQQVKEVIVLVPALLGLKGNLEMTLASRLSTQVNLKQIHDKRTMMSAILGNFAVTQIQSIVVGFLASFIACITELISVQKLNVSNLLTLISTSVATASLASLLLGGAIMLIIIISSRCNINPDNIATPLAASLGDLVTLAILWCIGTFFFIYKHLFWIHIIFIVLFVIAIPFLAIYCRRNSFVKETLKHGWSPVIVAMIISSLAGVILEIAIKVYSGIAIYQPVVNGVGGNIVGIFASRLSTSLHKTGDMGRWAHWSPKKFFRYPYETFFAKSNPEHKTGLVLMGLTLPGHTLFFFIIYFIKASTSQFKLTAPLVIFYLAFVFLQVLILLVLCYFMVHVFWHWNLNPDNMCIPLLTAIGDFLGVSFLFLCFHLVYLTGNTSLRTPTTMTSLLSTFTSTISIPSNSTL
ncbi:unnamed protein product [Brachionus calyciflorus]|uniref:SLC41A/MgtE integral membrane domain-containing protein n=1 Tax=Brachionus calyciflorus TaxID=104777 RepID=A0A814FZW2_9BILA|nr:unnamed protein product [Brachionus calyciflorus]